MRTLNASVLRRYRGKTCLLRVDLNIESNDPAGMFRLDAIIPTIKLLLRSKVKVVIVSHRGRPLPVDEGNLKPGNKVPKKVSELSLGEFAPLIATRVKVPVDFVEAYRVQALVRTALTSTARVVLLENIRFFRGEEANDVNFAKALSKLADFYVNDAFAVSHRKNASVCAITAFLPSYAGPLLDREVRTLSGIVKGFVSPFVVIVGGAKAADKLGVIERLWGKADTFLVGGGAANTILAAEGIPVGRSLYEPDIVKDMKRYAFSGDVVLPVDVREGKRAILDIGPKTEREFARVIAGAKTIIWNGPMGLFEKKLFASGTRAVWRAILKSSARIVVGGGETIASANLIPNSESQLTARKNIFLSTGGSAMLLHLAGKKLPGLEALK